MKKKREEKKCHSLLKHDETSKYYINVKKENTDAKEHFIL